MEKKQGAQANQGQSSRTNFAGLFPEDMPISGVSRGVEFLAEGVGIETTPEGRRFSGQVPFVQQAKQGLASIAQDPMGALRGAGEAVSGFLEEQMQASAIRPNEMVMGEDGQMRPATGEELSSALDPTLGGTFAAPIIARGAVGGLEGLMPEAGVVSIFGAASKRPALEKIAIELKNQGESSQEIFRKTGVFPGDDGALRYEIDDSKAKFVGSYETNEYGNVILSDIPKPLTGDPIKLGDVLKHEKLYEYYPEARDIPLRDTPLFSLFVEGSFNPQTGAMTLARSTGKKDVGEAFEGARQTLLHELQHYVQYQHDFYSGGNKGEFLPESFAPVRTYVREERDKFDKEIREAGGNPFEMYRLPDDIEYIQAVREREALEGLDPEIDRFTIQDLKRAEERVNMAKDALGSEEAFNNYVKLINANEKLSAIDSSAFNAYKRLSGEAEARQVEARSRMTPEERAENMPMTTEEFLQKENISGQPVPSREFELTPEMAQERRVLEEQFESVIQDIGWDPSSDVGEVKKYAVGGLVSLSTRGRDGIVDVIRKYRREGLMD